MSIDPQYNVFFSKMDNFTSHNGLNMSLFSIPINDCHEIRLENENVLEEGAATVRQVDLEEERVDRVVAAGREVGDTSHEFYKTFSLEELGVITRLVRNDGEDNATIFSFGGGDVVTLASLQRIFPTSKNKWVNDEGMNAYVIHVIGKDRVVQENKCKFASSYFYHALMDIGNSGRYRHIKWKSLNGMFDEGRRVMLPINIGNLHWIGVIIDIENRRLMSCDSFNKDRFDILHNLLDFLMDEWNLNYKDNNGGMTFSDKFGKWEMVKVDAPEQHNSVDCGIFTCMFLRSFAYYEPITVRQGLINKCRWRLILELDKAKKVN